MAKLTKLREQLVRKKNDLKIIEGELQHIQAIHEKIKDEVYFANNQVEKQEVDELVNSFGSINFKKVSEEIYEALECNLNTEERQEIFVCIIKGDFTQELVFKKRELTMFDYFYCKELTVRQICKKVGITEPRANAIKRGFIAKLRYSYHLKPIQTAMNL